MPYEIIRADITKMRVDAIVNAANESLLGGGGVDGAIHRAAGPELLAECRTLHGCKTGDAKVTKGYRLPAKYVIHTVGPVWHGGRHDEEKLLISCYRRSLEEAEKYGCESVAFPLISSGVYGYPKAQALKIAVDTVTAFLTNTDMMVYIIVFDRASLHISETLYGDIRRFIDENYVEEHEDNADVRRRRRNLAREMTRGAVCDACVEMPAPLSAPKSSLEDMIGSLDESFSQMVLRKIDEKGMKDSECYKKANLDRKLFSKVRNPDYRPSKPTAVALGLALELPRDEFDDLLMKAGFVLSRSSKFDVIIEYFLSKGVYDINEINATLFEFDQSTLGTVA